MTDSSTTKPVPHQLLSEMRERGFVVSRIAVRMGESYGWLYGRLAGRVPCTPEDEARIRRAMDPDPEAPAQPSAQLP